MAGEGTREATPERTTPKRTARKRPTERRYPAAAVAVVTTVTLLLAGCRGSSKPGAVAPSTTATTSGVAGSGSQATATTAVPIQTSGTRTILSPIGLNVRAQPSTTAAVVGSAAQGATVTVLGHTSGWYQVQGATVTGYITDDPTLSAGGKFMDFNSSQDNFSALYPAGWTVREVPPVSVVFRPPSGGDSIVVTTAAMVSALPVVGSGYHQDGSASTVVVCGVTASLITLAATGGPAPTIPPSTQVGATTAERYVAQVNLTLDGTHALGLDAELADLAQLPTVMNVMFSLSFPFPQCLGGTTSSATTVTPSTVF